jgi:hypothetical protein
MNRGRVGEERGGKEMDRCPLTVPASSTDSHRNSQLVMGAQRKKNICR